MEFLVRRYGTKAGIHYRGGLWFEIVTPDYEKYTHSYFEDTYDSFSEDGDFAEYAVSNVSMHYAFVNVEKPYFFSVDRENILGESHYPIALYSEVFKKSFWDVYNLKFEIEGKYPDEIYKPEMAYAELEQRIAEKLRSRGYDSAILVKNLYDEVLFNSGDLDCIDKDQIFYFGTNIRWLS